MKIWLISQTENTRYDTFASAVVAAEDDAAARATHPIGCYGPRFAPCAADWQSDTWVDGPAKVTARLIGIASEGTKPGVILADFNAG